MRIVLADGAVRVAEVHAGGGYLSQSSTRLSFGLGATAAAKRVEVRWPSGQTATVVTAPEARRLALRE